MVELMCNYAANCAASSANGNQASTFFCHFQFDNSDSEEDEDVLNNLEPIYESRNVYHLRRLPHVVGTAKFMVRFSCHLRFSITVSAEKFTISDDFQ